MKKLMALICILISLVSVHALDNTIHSDNYFYYTPPGGPEVQEEPDSCGTTDTYQCTRARDICTSQGNWQIRFGAGGEWSNTVNVNSATDCFQYIGLRIRDGGVTKRIAVWQSGRGSSALRIRKGGVTYSVALVNPGHAEATGFRIRVSGTTYALREYLGP